MNKSHESYNDYWKHYVRNIDYTEILENIEELYISGEAPIHIDIFQISEQYTSKIIFIHGTAVYSRFYAEFLHFLCKMGYQVIVPDMIGHGLSGGKKGHFTMNQILKVVYSVIDLCREKYHGKLFLMGSSLGGITSLYAAADKRIDGVIYHNAAIFNEGAHKEIVKVSGLLKFPVPFVPLASKVLPIFPISVLLYLPKHQLVSSIYGGKIFDLLLKDPLFCKYYTLKSLSTQMTESIPYELSDLSCPVLLINGENDRLFSIPYIQSIASRIRNGNLKIIDNADHLIFHENIEESIEIITSFISSIDSM
ncbi:MAG: alpha/beta fold hydrolase [Candidatus Heimdallarchaeota archaeon]|nr:alpha/beta fold hydrolase [Candidatus Heimdallarchaeota archaeon]